MKNGRAFGGQVRPLVRRVFFASSLVVGAIVSLTGLIGFVGLVVPQATRRLVGADFRMVLPVTLLAGASVLVLSDFIARASFSRIQRPPWERLPRFWGGRLRLGFCGDGAGGGDRRLGRGRDCGARAGASGGEERGRERERERERDARRGEGEGEGEGESEGEGEGETRERLALDHLRWGRGSLTIPPCSEPSRAGLWRLSARRG